MNLIPVQYQALAHSRYLLRKIEETNQKINSPKTVSVFSLLNQFYLTNQEKQKHLKNKNFFQKCYFYLMGQTSVINKKMDNEIKFEKAFKNMLLDKIAPLDPSSEVLESISEIFVYKKHILQSLKSTHKIAKGISLGVTAFSFFWLNYNLKQTFHDYRTYCNIKTEFQSIKDMCPFEKPLPYFYNLNAHFLALPLIAFIGLALNQLNCDFFTKLIFSPLDNIRRSAYMITERVSNVKDFLLDKASDPTFKRPGFSKEGSE